MDLISTHPVKKLDLGFHGNLFGGKLLSWIDAAVAAYAMEKCHSKNMITIALDKCVFEKAAKEGQLVKIYAYTTKIGNTSVTLYMEARSHNVYSGMQSTILSTNMKFVRIDENGDAIPISDRVRNKYNKPIK